MDDQDILCSRCRVPLQMKKVTVTYLKSTFPAELPCCPECGQVYISEALALGKIVEVEKTLEDK